MNYSWEHIEAVLRQRGLLDNQLEAIHNHLKIMSALDMDTNEYIATTTSSRQISEDRYQVYHPSIKLYNDTTIGDIKKWHKSLGCPVMDDVQLMELKPIR